MPFNPDYTITHGILNNIAAAEAAKQIIENSTLIPHWERQFRNQALVRTIHHSIAIEGNALSIKETEQLVAGEELSTIRLRDVQEIINYRDVIGYVSVSAEKILTMGYLLRIHKRLGKRILEPEKLGVLRKNQAVIVNSKTGDVVFDPPRSEEIENELEDLIEWDRTKPAFIHPLLSAGIIHHELVRIHPFVDLNGRTSRIMATWSMYRDGYDIKKFFSLEEHYDQDLIAYYDALESGNDGDLTTWLEYFTNGVAVELTRVKKQVLELSRDHKLLKQIGQVALNERQIKIINHVETNGSIRNQDFAKLFADISDDTILRDLKDLISKKIIKKRGKTKAASYILS